MALPPYLPPFAALHVADARDDDDAPAWHWWIEGQAGDVLAYGADFHPSEDAARADAASLAPVILND